MAIESIRALILDGSVANAKMIAAASRTAATQVHFQRVDNEQEFRSSLSEAWDIVLANNGLSALLPIRALEILRERGEATPLIVISNSATHEDAAAACIQQGASDFIGSDQTGRLGLSVRAALLRKQFQEQQPHARDMEVAAQLAAGIGHDLNNLVTVIGGYSSLLIREPRLPASVKSKLQEIDDAGRRAAQLTGQLLAFASKHVRQPSLMDVNGVIGGIEPVLRSVLGDAIELRLQLQQAPGVVHTDVGGLEQVLLNLAANARDAMDHAGVLEIATSTMPGGSIAIAMTDHGCGMTPETRSRIFEPYFTTKGTGKGAGMGLSIAYGIVKAAGGQITVESAVSRGSTFRVILPLFEPGTPDPARAIKARTDLFTPVSAAVEKKSALCRHETILLVEDQEQMRELVLAVLEPHGYYILAAGSAGEAIELCAAHEGPIDLLLTDIQMPDVSGTELARMMYESYPQMKTIYMSGSEDWGRGPQTRDPNAFLLKPFHPKDLAEKVREVLDLSTSPSVLVVDDDPQIRSLLRNVLGEAGYSVEEAHGGRQALDRVRQKMPDLLITDLIMPEMEGMETITRIRKAAPRLKIIAMSGCVDSLYLDTARMLGAHATFAKPLALDALLAAVSGLLHQPATVA